MFETKSPGQAAYEKWLATDYKQLHAPWFGLNKEGQFRWKQIAQAAIEAHFQHQTGEEQDNA